MGKPDRHNIGFDPLISGCKAILNSDSFESAARSLFYTCKELIGASSGYVALLSETGEENEVLFLDAGGLPCSVDPSLPMPIRGLRGEAYREKEAKFNNDFSREVAYWHRYVSW